MNVFELFATLSLDTSGFDEGLESSESKGSSFASKLGSGFAKAGGMLAKATTAGFVAAGTGVTALTKSAVASYGEFEQLTGGVEKLFGTSADAVFDYANQAYATAGLSANEYMETVTGFSAALIQGLEGDTDEAARLSDLAIRDMADNVNVYGSDMESVMSAYQGFAKQNWTLLDNLKLGYGGTEAEMVRLINDAGLLEEEITDMDEVSFDQVIASIHKIQEETNIAGTTAKEASSTLQGSASAMKSAWDNLLTGLADPNANLGVLIGNLVDSAKSYLGNLIPIATQALSGISQLIEGLAPIVAEELPKLAETVLPSLLSAITTLLDTAVKVVTTILPSLIQTVLPSLISAGISLITAFVNVLPSILGILQSALPQLFGMLIPAIISVLPSIIEAGISLIMALAQALGDNAEIIINAIVLLVQTIAYTMLNEENLTMFIQVAVQLIEALVAGLLEATPDLLAMVPYILFSVASAIINNTDTILIALGHILVALGEALVGGIGALMGMGKEQTAEALSAVYEVVVEGLNTVVEFFSDVGESITTGVSTMWTSVSSFFTDGLSGLSTLVSDGLDGIATLFSDIWDTVKTYVSDGIETVKGLFDFDWSLPDLKVPHISVTGGESPWGIGGKGSLPSFDIEWYRKAYDDAYMLNDPTIFGFSGGTLLGGGEGNGGEMVMGEEYFRNIMLESAGRIQIQPIVNVYIAGEELDSYTESADKRIALIGGGRG